MLAVLIKYVHSRHLFNSIQGSMSTANSNARAGQPTGAKIKVDKMLLLRFTIAFVILSAFEVCLISFQFSRKINAARLANEQQPDLSVGSAISDILQFIPGVTAGLVAFGLFGTTAQFRKKYGDAFRSMRFRRKEQPSPERTAGMLGWDALGSTRLGPTYRCTIVAGDFDGVEMLESGTAGKSRPAVTVQDENKTSAARPILPQPSMPPVPQPWRNLGIPRP